MTKKHHRHTPRRSETHIMEYASYVGVVIGFLLIFGVSYFEFIAPEQWPSFFAASDAGDATAAFGDSPMLPDEYDEAEVLSLSDLQRGQPGQEDPEDPEDAEAAEEAAQPIIEGSVAAGDTVSALLSPWLSQAEILDLTETAKKLYDIRNLKVNHPYAVHQEEKRLTRFEYEIDDDKKIAVTRELNNAWTAKFEPIIYDIRLVKYEGTIKTNLADALKKAGAGRAVGKRIAQIFAWEVNFIRDLTKGDRFRLLLEARYRGDEFKGYGKLPAVEFVNRSSKYEAYAFTDSYGESTYFNAAGESLKRAFLKAPLAYRRISSHFNLARRHPIFKTVRPHPAIDYAAASGTPVKAIGSGVVKFRGFDRGAGNYITLQHHSGYESMYLHLRGFAPGLEMGKRVKQGEVIGYVGNTGFSTGPHLDFRMKKDGQFINPEKTLAPRDEAVPKKQLRKFKTQRDVWRNFLDGKRKLSDYQAIRMTLQ